MGRDGKTTVTNGKVDRLDDLERELAEFKRLTKCDSIQSLKIALDQAEFELITARALVAVIREKVPEIYTEVVLWLSKFTEFHGS